MSTRIPAFSLQPTRQEKTAGLLSATLLLLGLLTFFMFVMWISQQQSYSPTITRVSLRAEHEGGAGTSGAADVARTLEDQRTEDQPLAMDQAAELLQTVSRLAITELSALEGSGGSAKGPGAGDERALGPGGPGGPVVPIWRRWHIRYSAAGMDEYSSILDAFGVELGAIGRGEKTIDFARHLSQSRPLIRQGKAAAENRLRFLMERGESQEADRILAAKAGLSIEGKGVWQFYPNAVRQQLELLERRALGARPLANVRRTVFGIRQSSGRWEFFVERVELASGGTTPQ